MKRLFVAVGVLSAGLLAWTPTSTAAPSSWQGSVSFTNQVASEPTKGGGYPVPPGSQVPLAGTHKNGLHGVSAPFCPCDTKRSSEQVAAEAEGKQRCVVSSQA